MAPYVRCHMSTVRHILMRVACLSPLSPLQVVCAVFPPICCHWSLPSVPCVTLHSAINPSLGRGTGFHQLMDGADNSILSSKHTLIQLSSYYHISNQNFCNSGKYCRYFHQHSQNFRDHSNYTELAFCNVSQIPQTATSRAWCKSYVRCEGLSELFVLTNKTQKEVLKSNHFQDINCLIVPGPLI